MPVTIKVASHDARPVTMRTKDGAGDPQKQTSQGVLESIAHEDKKDIGDILQTQKGMVQTSLTDERLKDMQMYPEDHGLIRAAFHAYSYHHNLVLRPEDIWFAILAQFSFYVNAHSEELRKHFVAHKGKKGLILKAPAEDDMSLMCRNMTKLMDENVVDPELREWVLPSFSTTTVEDETVAAIIMMGTLQSYFEYVFDCSACGIPSVTMLGEKKDWEDIARRIEKLEKYGKEPAQFGALLKPVLREMIACFDDDNEFGATFWNRMVDYMGGSGMDTLSGWITVFAYWNEDGKLLVPPGDEDRRYYWHRTFGKTLPERLRDIKSPSVEMNEIPCCFVSVPVVYITPDSKQIETKLLAGFAGFEATTVAASTKSHPSRATQAPKRRQTIITKSRDKILSLFGATQAEKDIPQDSKSSVSPSGEEESDKLQPRDTLRPVTAWWMFKVKDPKDAGNKSLAAFYADKLANYWEGGASTGYVQEDKKTVVVEQGLPRDL